MIKSAMILLLFATSLLAQTERHAALGDRVRIRAPRAGYGRITGEVTSTTPDALQVRINGGTEIGVMRSQIDELMLSVSSRRNTTRGAVIGAILFGAAGFLYGPEDLKPNQPPGTGKPASAFVIGAAVGGAAVGALAGHYTQTDTWIRVTPRP